MHHSVSRLSDNVEALTGRIALSEMVKIRQETKLELRRVSVQMETLSLEMKKVQGVQTRILEHIETVNVKTPSMEVGQKVENVKLNMEK